MTSEQRERIMASSYIDVLNNTSVRELLHGTVTTIPPDIDDIFDRAVEEFFGLSVAEIDDEALEHARKAVRTARHRLVK